MILTQLIGQIIDKIQAYGVNIRNVSHRLSEVLVIQLF